MAAITPVAGSPYPSRVPLRAASSATTTDWLDVPAWCNAIKVHLRVTVAGTNTILTIREANPVARDDAAGNTVTVVTSATITATGYHTYLLHPNATAVADQAAANTAVQAAVVVPRLVGITTTPTGSTYTTEIEFLKV
jgi:hypothetical protein